MIYSNPQVGDLSEGNFAQIADVCSERAAGFVTKQDVGLSAAREEDADWRAGECFSTYTSSITKRIFDIVLSVAIIIVLIPLMIAIAVVIKLSDPGPIFFTQDRFGRAVYPFKILKFRTMTTEASSNAFAQATRGDIRITKFGAFLRRTSLDELPQLFNVLVGQMSLVGPRPHPIDLDVEYRDAVPDYNQRYHSRPGMTGLAQVSGSRGPTPNIESMRFRIEHDILYMRQASFLFEVRILFLTAREVIRSSRAF